MEIQELIIGPLYFIVIMMFAYSIRNRVGDIEMQKHFLRGLLLKLTSSIGLYFLYFFYYNGGDTYTYYNRIIYLTHLLYSDLNIGLQVLTQNPEVYNLDTNWHFLCLSANDSATFLIVKFGTIFNLICFNSYIGIAYFFGLIAYVSVWKLMKIFINIYPDNKKEITFSFLYLPSVFFWSAGILKDSVTLAFLCLIIISIYYVFIERKKIIQYSIIFIVSTYIVGSIKSYILLALIPATIIWIFMTYRNNLKSSILRTLVTPIFFVVIVIGITLTVQGLSKVFTKFSIENIETKATNMQNWHTKVVEVYQGGEGSSYNLGIIEFTPIGIIKKIPAAINVALYRPWIWESRNIVMILESIESTIFLFISLSLLYYLLTNSYISSVIISRNATIIFSLIFSLTFAFSVGFTSYNFGALSRYRIPLLPFYLFSILILRSLIKRASIENKLKSK